MHAPKPVHESTLPAVLVIEDMAKLLGTSVCTVRERMKRPDWPFTPLVQIDRRTRWSRDQVLTMLAATPSRRK